jgi:hypothetical protein
MDTADDRRPWEQEAEEPGNWFDRLERFRLAGPRRSLLAIYNAERAQRNEEPARDIPGAWKEAASLWRWRDRAKAWDLAEQQRRRDEHEKDREEDRASRIYLLKITRNKLVQALQEMAPERIRPETLLSGIRMVTQELRTEYADLPPMPLDYEKLSDDELRAIAAN